MKRTVLLIATDGLVKDGDQTAESSLVTNFHLRNHKLNPFSSETTKTPNTSVFPVIFF